MGRQQLPGGISTCSCWQGGGHHTSRKLAWAPLSQGQGHPSESQQGQPWHLGPLGGPGPAPALDGASPLKVPTSGARASSHHRAGTLATTPQLLVWSLVVSPDHPPCPIPSASGHLWLAVLPEDRLQMKWAESEGPGLGYLVQVKPKAGTGLRLPVAVRVAACAALTAPRSASQHPHVCGIPPHLLWGWGTEPGNRACPTRAGA